MTPKDNNKEHPLIMHLTDQQKNEYLHRSYTAVDGLWFMKVEQQYGFDSALDIDEQVWHILPKIQARELKEVTGLTSGLEALRQCLTAKLELDHLDFTSSTDPDDRRFTITINHCHWCHLLEKSGRGHLAGAIGTRICRAEYSTWAREFGSDISFEPGLRICNGADRCILSFASS